MDPYCYMFTTIQLLNGKLETEKDMLSLYSEKS